MESDLGATDTILADLDLEKLKEIWTQEQYKQRQLLVLRDSSCLINKIEKNELLVGGLDISFSKVKRDWAVAALAVVNMKSKKMLYSVSLVVHLTVPYIPTFLGYREVPSFGKLVQKFETIHPDLASRTIYVVDGNGTMHPRGYGCACQLGLQIEKPVFGVAKNLLSLSDSKTMHKLSAEQLDQLNSKGDSVELRNDCGEVSGLALLNSGKSKIPVFVSPGHLISLETARDLTIRMSKFRIPEPTRQADLISRNIVNKLDVSGDYINDLFL